MTKPPRQFFRLHARYCWYCCNIIGKWAAFFGQVACGRCSSRMAMGGAPRCYTDDTTSYKHRHGLETES